MAQKISEIGPNYVSRMVRKADIPHLMDLCERLRHTSGGCTPRTFYLAAKTDKVANRYVFHVKTRDAAERYYIERARHILAAIEIQQLVRTGKARRVETVSVRALHHTCDGHQPLSELQRRSDYREEVIEDAMRLVMQLQTKCAVLGDDELMQALTGVRNLLRRRKAA